MAPTNPLAQSVRKIVTSVRSQPGERRHQLLGAGARMRLAGRAGVDQGQHGSATLDEASHQAFGLLDHAPDPCIGGRGRQVARRLACTSR